MIRTDNIETFKGVQYRVVRGYPDYLVSEYGVIIHKEKGFVRTMDSPDGYRYALLTDSSGRKSQVPVHRFVATAWLRNPTRKTSILHLDGNTSNNVLSNIRWATDREILKHSTHSL